MKLNVSDFNFPNIDWSDPVLISDSDRCSVLFTQFSKQNVFQQLVCDVTRHSTTGRGSVIDMVLCNDHFTFHNVQVFAPFITSDHCTSFEVTVLNLGKQFTNWCRYNFKNADWVAINSHLSTFNWYENFSSCLHAEQYSAVFYNIIYDCLEKYVPLVFNVSGNGSKRNGFCYPPSVRKLMRKKLAAWYRYKKFRTPNCLFRFKHISVERREACFAARARHEEKIVEPGNIGKFFRYANSKLNARHNVGPLRKSDPAIKAELLSIYFSSVFTTDNGSCVTASANKTSGNISNITFTEQHVSRAI